MLALYIGCTVATLALILISAFAGAHGGDADHGGDIDHSHDTGEHDSGEHDAGTHSWMPWLSVRFWTYFCAGFGLVGLLCTLLTKASQNEILIWALVTGLVAGLGVSYIMRLARKYESGATLGARDFEGKVGHLSVACGPGQLGKVRLEMEGETIDYLAKTEHQELLPVGSQVIIVSVEGDTALVVAESDLMK